MAQWYQMPAVAIVFHLPEEICVHRNLSRPERCVPLHTIWTQSADLQRSLPDLAAEGFREVWILNSLEEIDAARIDRTRNNRSPA
jgi:protein phosphatase